MRISGFYRVCIYNELYIVFDLCSSAKDGLAQLITSLNWMTDCIQEQLQVLGRPFLKVYLLCPYHMTGTKTFFMHYVLMHQCIRGFHSSIFSINIIQMLLDQAFFINVLCCLLSGSGVRALLRTTNLLLRLAYPL